MLCICRYLFSVLDVVLFRAFPLQLMAIIPFDTLLQVYVTSGGQELTGRFAYRHYKKVLVFFLIANSIPVHARTHTSYKEYPHLCCMFLNWRILFS